MKRVLALACSAALCISWSTPATQLEDPKSWAAWLDTRAAGFSGVVLVGRGDEVVVTRAYGDADHSAGRKNTVASRFNLGSINKTFTATAIAQLIQQGRLSLDDTLDKHLPDYPNRAAAARITIRDLITHRSGVAVFMRADFGLVSVAEMVKVVGTEPQSFEPGARQEYSNGGYVVLGRVLEVVSGKSYDSYVSEQIYQPAGMTTAGFVGPDQLGGDFALGHFSADAQGRPMIGGPSLRAAPPRRGNPAGGGYAAASDLFKFARALKSGRLLDQRMTDYVLHGTFAGEPTSRFGFALREQVVGMRRFLGNGGGAPGVNAEFRFEPAGDYTVVVLSNTSPPAATCLLTDVLNHLDNQ